MIRLLLHHILIKLDDAVEADDVYRRAKAAGLELQLDKREKEAVEYGTVVQVGPTAYVELGRDSNILKGGDRVSVIRYSGKRVVDSDGSVYHIFNDDDILCVID